MTDRPATLRGTPIHFSDLRAGDLAMNQYGQVLWTALTDAVPFTNTDRDGNPYTAWTIDVITPTDERFTRVYDDSWPFALTSSPFGQHRIIRFHDTGGNQ